MGYVRIDANEEGRGNMKVKTNIFYNGPHVEEELEEWLNEPHDGALVSVILTERADEPSRLIARAVFDVKRGPVFEDLVRQARDNERDLADLNERLADIEAETKHAHQEVGALVSVVLEVHRLVETISDSVHNISLIKAALAKCIEPHVDERGRPTGATVVNLTRLLPPQG